MEDQFRVRTEDKLKALAYFQKRAVEYDTATAAGPMKLLRVRERGEVLRLADFRAPGTRRMIDVGCGSGLYSRHGKQAGLEVVAMDVSPGMVEAAGRVADRALIGDIETFESDLEFDVVVCAGALEFVLNPERAFRNLCRLVNRGGRMVLLLPSSDRWWGNLYRLEKIMAGMRVNLFGAEWVSRISGDEGLRLTEVARPLPYNMVVRLDRL